VAGDEITRFSRAKLTAWRARHVGFIFQMYNLIPVLTAFRNVELPLLLTPLDRQERRKHVLTALGLVGLSDRMDHYPRQLSGASSSAWRCPAIVADPTFLLCDEPTGDLDRHSAAEILDLVELLVRDHGKTVLMVTHDPRAAERAQVTLHLDKGVLMEAAEGRREVPAPPARQPGPQEGAHPPHHRLVRRGPLPVRLLVAIRVAFSAASTWPAPTG